MTAWKNIVEDFRKNLPDQFKAFGGVSPLDSKTISATLVEGDFDEALQKEIYSAVVQEIGVELFNGLINDARRMAPIVKHFDKMHLDQMLSFVIAVWDSATSMDSNSAIIVSPTHLTLMQAGGGDIFVRDERIENDVFGQKENINSVRRVGKIKGHVVYCDQYAADDRPTLIVAPGWFSYVLGNTLTASKIITLPEDESSVRFATDVQLVIDRSKVKAISVDPSGMLFY